MIRIFSDGFVPRMDLFELQGNIQLPPDAVKEAPSASSSSNAAERPAPPADNETSDEVVVLGHVVKDHLNPKQRTLRIGTLQVTGGYHTFKQPMLVLRAHPPADASSSSSSSPFATPETVDTAPATDEPSVDAKEPSSPISASASPLPSAEPVLFEEWLESHPNATSLEYVFRKDPHHNVSDGASRKRPRDGEEETAPDTMKDYQLVGWIEDKIVFNSKPARVFL